jgi:hypothetical protein
MPACIIPFPSRRPAADKTRYDLIKDVIAQALLSAAPARPGREDEIINLLRRIDRRLAKIATAQEAT